MLSARPQLKWRFLAGRAALSLILPAVYPALGGKPINIDVPVPAAKRAPEAVPAPAESSDVTYKRDALDRAVNLARQGNVAQTNAVIEEVRQKFGVDDPFVDELRGTILTIEKNYPGAEAAFKAMLAKVPDSRIAQFNLAETSFLQKRYQVAEQSFAEIESAQRATDPAVADLCRFKRVVCLLANGSAERAVALLPDKDQGPSSPAVEYAWAAVRFARKDPAAAAAVVEKARGEFSPEVENLYTDSFVELRWGNRNADGKFAFENSLK